MRPSPCPKCASTRRPALPYLQPRSPRTPPRNQSPRLHRRRRPHLQSLPHRLWPIQLRRLPRLPRLPCLLRRKNRLPALPAAIQLAQTVHQSQTLIQPDAPKDLLLLHPTPVPLVMMLDRAGDPPPTKSAVVSSSAEGHHLQHAFLGSRGPIASPSRSRSTSPLRTSTPRFLRSPRALPRPSSCAGRIRPSRCRPPRRRQRRRPPPCASSLSPTARCRRGPLLCPWPTPARARRPRSRSPPARVRTPPTRAAAAHPASSLLPYRRVQAQPRRSPPAPVPTTRPAAVATLAFRSRPARRRRPRFWRPRRRAQPSSAGIGTENSASVARITTAQGWPVRRSGRRLLARRPVSGDRRRLERPAGLHRLPPRRPGQRAGSCNTRCRPTSQAAASGTRPDAPWPYDIVVPKLAPEDYTSDAPGHSPRLRQPVRPLRAHVDGAALAEFAQAKFVLNTLFSSGSSAPRARTARPPRSRFCSSSPPRKSSRTHRSRKSRRGITPCNPRESSCPASYCTRATSRCGENPYGKKVHRDRSLRVAAEVKFVL